MLGHNFAPLELPRTARAVRPADCAGEAPGTRPRGRPYPAHGTGDGTASRRRLGGDAAEARTPRGPLAGGARAAALCGGHTGSGPSACGAAAEGPAPGGAARPGSLLPAPRGRARAGRGRRPFRGAVAAAASVGRLPSPPPAALGDASPIAARGEPQLGAQPAPFRASPLAPPPP